MEVERERGGGDVCDRLEMKIGEKLTVSEVRGQSDFCRSSFSGRHFPGTKKRRLNLGFKASKKSVQIGQAK